MFHLIVAGCRLACRYVRMPRPGALPLPFKSLLHHSGSNSAAKHFSKHDRCNTPPRHGITTHRRTILCLRDSIHHFAIAIQNLATQHRCSTLMFSAVQYTTAANQSEQYFAIPLQNLTLLCLCSSSAYRKIQHLAITEQKCAEPRLRCTTLYYTLAVQTAQNFT